MRFESHQCWFPKDEELPSDYEDASAISERKGRVVVADGVSSAIFSRAWARLLTRTAVESSPLFTDDCELTTWVGQLQKTWREGINFSALTWFQKPKATTVGAQCTLLVLDIEPFPIEPRDDCLNQSDAEEKNKPTADYRLTAHAIGDCCLFIIRNGEKILSFPMTRSETFADPPHVISSIAKDAAYADKFQHLDTHCHVGDIVAVCTDAVGLWAMQEYESGRSVEWMRYWKDDPSWQADIQMLRKMSTSDQGNRMRVDDCTLLLLRVISESVNESEPQLQPDRSDEPFVLYGAENVAETEVASASETAGEAASSAATIAKDMVFVTESGPLDAPQANEELAGTHDEIPPSHDAHRDSELPVQGEATDALATGNESNPLPALTSRKRLLWMLGLK